MIKDKNKEDQNKIIRNLARLFILGCKERNLIRTKLSLSFPSGSLIRRMKSK